MITISPAAAKQMLKSFHTNPVEASSTDNETMILRIAVEEKPNGDFHYIMGLDEAKSDDVRFISNDVPIALSEKQNVLMDKMEIDYIEVKPNEFNFIFKNPNDPKYQQPTQ